MKTALKISFIVFGIPFIILIILLNLFPLAHADRINFIGLRHEVDRLQTCIFQPDPNITEIYKSGYHNATINGINTWKEGLENYTKNQWLFNTFTYQWQEHKDLSTSDYRHCNVLIVYDLRDLNGTALGKTSYDFRSSEHKFAFVTLYTKTQGSHIQLKLGGNMTSGKAVMPLEANWIDSRILEQVATHEMGHALGLLHEQETLAYTFASIMQPNVDVPYNKYVKMTYHDLVAITNIYGVDGFKKAYRLPIPAFYGR